MKKIQVDYNGMVDRIRFFDYRKWLKDNKHVILIIAIILSILNAGSLIYYALYYPDKVFDYNIFCDGITFPTDYEHAQEYQQRLAAEYNNVMFLNSSVIQ